MYISVVFYAKISFHDLFDRVIFICFDPILKNFRKSNSKGKGKMSLKSMLDTGLDVSYAEINKINIISNALSLPSSRE